MEKKQKGTLDMTEGNCAKNILIFALPLIAGSFLQEFYNVVDSWVVGNYVGDSALAAVGIAFPVVFLFVSLFMGISTGATVVISQFFGAGKMDEVKKTVETVYFTFLVAIIPLTVLVLLLVNPLLKIMNVDPACLDDSRTYLIIIGAGLIGQVGYNTNSGILQGLGNSRAPLLFLAISAVLNIGLDLTTVIVWHMGVAGVAYATIFAQGVSWIFGIVYINKKYPYIKIISLKELRYHKTIFREVIRIGLPAGLQSAFVALGVMAVMSKVNSYGEAWSAGYNAGHKVDHIGFLPIQAFSTAATAFVGQNIGANKPERVKQGTKAALLMCFAWCAITNALIIPFRPEIIGFFTSTEAVKHAGARYILACMPFYPFFSVMFCLNSIMRGAGDSIAPMFIAFLAQVLLRVPLVYLLDYLYGPDYMFFGFSIAWVIASIVAFLYYRGGRWKRFRSIAHDTNPA